MARQPVPVVRLVAEERAQLEVNRRVAVVVSSAANNVRDRSDLLSKHFSFLVLCLVNSLSTTNFVFIYSLQ